eukprot:g9728.t1
MAKQPKMQSAQLEYYISASRREISYSHSESWTVRAFRQASRPSERENFSEFPWQGEDVIFWVRPNANVIHNALRLRTIVLPRDFFSEFR